METLPQPTPRADTNTNTAAAIAAPAQTLGEQPRTRLNKLHRWSGVTLAMFIGLHLCTHLFALVSIQANIEAMRLARLVYRNPFVEVILLLAVVTQVVSGIQLVCRARTQGGLRGMLGALPAWERLRVFSGLYVAFFLLAHTFATVILGRKVMHVDTNFYFGSYVLVMIPMFYLPYYALGVISVFAHIASVHRTKIAAHIGLKQATAHAWVIIVLGVVVTTLILLGYGGALYQIDFPKEYRLFSK
jgi:hypothetical protein